MASYRTILLASLLLAPSLLAGDAGTVKGSFTVAGKTFTPDHVYAVRVPGSYDTKMKDVVVIFTLNPREKDLLLAFGHGGPGGTDLTVTLGQGPALGPAVTVINFMCHLKGASMKEDEYYSGSGIDSSVFQKKTFDSGKKGRVAGKIRFAAEKLDSGGKKVLTSDIDFDVPILGDKG
jgi:hypothetical protein